MIALLSAEAEETGQQGTVAPSVHTPHYYKVQGRVSAANSKEISIYFDKYIFGYNKYFLAYFWVENKYMLE